MKKIKLKSTPSRSLRKLKQSRPSVFDEGIMIDVATKLISELSDEAFSALSESKFKSLCAKRYHQHVRSEAISTSAYASSHPFTTAARQLVRG